MSNNDRKSTSIVIKKTTVDTAEIVKNIWEVVKHRQARFKELPELSFDVIKIHHIFKSKQQQRVLKLTSDGILNCKQNGTKITRAFPYSSIAKVVLIDAQNFVVKPQKEHDFYYRSQVAIQIVQELNSRIVKTKRQLARQNGVSNSSKTQQGEGANGSASGNDRSSLDDLDDGIDLSMDYQKKINVHANSAVAQEEEAAAAVAAREAEEASKRQNDVLGNVALSSSPSTSTAPSPSSSFSGQRKARKLHKLLGNTEEQRISLAVESIIFDPKSDERYTIQDFIGNGFTLLEKQPSRALAEVRKFINQLRGYLLEKRGPEFDNLLILAQKESDSAQDLTVSKIIEIALERAIILPLNDRLAACACTVHVREREDKIREHISRVKTKPQEFFGISPDIQSPNAWAIAVSAMRPLETAELPADRLQALLSSAKAIYVAHNYYQNKGKSEKTTHFLSADDFLPIYMFVIVQCDIRTPVLDSELMWGLCDPEQLRGEAGYYLTVFCSALSYLENMNPVDGIVA